MVEVRTHRPVVDKEKCSTCAVCTKGCPAEIIPEMRTEESSLRGRIYKAPTFNIDRALGMPPCQLACPIYQDVTGYIGLIAKGKYEEALALIRETNPLPSVTGYICSHPCEISCLRNSVDDLVPIRALKRFVADFDDGRSAPPEVERHTGKRVSIIGSGPAGLAAAYDLLRMGYQVDVIEASPKPGGMLQYAIPPFRLPRNILERDINYIERMDVAIKTGIRFGVDVTLSDLKEEVEAVIIAIGTHENLPLPITNAEKCMDCLTFLKKYANGEPVDLGNEVIVIGAGNSGIDAARAALRYGAKRATMIDVLGAEEVVCDKDEMKEAEEEGVKVSYLTKPVRIIEKDGEIQGLECARVKPDKGQRRIAGSEFVMDATSVIVAIGQCPDLSWNIEGLPFKVSPKNMFIVDDNCQTSIEGLFAAGDAVSGPATVVEAMASGKKAASAVDIYLCGKG